jgi:hypothetical protein
MLDPHMLAEETVDLTCPYCGETSAVTIEADLEGELVQDCTVCCQPWLVTVERDRRGRLRATVEPAQ